MNTTPTRPIRTTSLRWQKWLIIFAVGILLPLFGVRVRAQAAAWSQLNDRSAVVAAPLEDDDDNGSDDDGSDDNGGDDANDDNGGDNDDSDDNGGDDANDDNGGDNDSSDDNGADDANDDHGGDNDGSDDNGADDANDDNGGDNDDSRTNSGRQDRDRAAVQRTGVITSLPATGRQGVWVIDGVTYFVTRNTEMSLMPGMGAIAVGQCVKLHIVPGTTNIVREVDVETAEHCTAGM